MKPATEFGDPQSTVKLYCDALLATPAADGHDFLQGLHIGTRLVTDRAPGRSLIVRSGPWVRYEYPVLAINRMRLVAFDLDEDVAWSIASWFHGHLLAHPGDDDIRSIRYDGGPEKSIDPDHNTPLAAFTLRASMRPIVDR